MAIPPNVKGLPGQAWVLNMASPKLQTTKTAIGPHEVPERFTATPAATAPTDRATDPSTAKNDAPAPPMIGCNQIASIAVRHAADAPESCAAFTRMPVATPATASHAVQLAPKIKIETRQMAAAMPVWPRTHHATASAERGNSAICAYSCSFLQ